MATKHLVVTGDPARMRRVASESVHLIITSPPAWKVRRIKDISYADYLEAYNRYHENLQQVWQECYRALLPGCKICVAVADTYCSSRQFGDFQILPTHADVLCELRALGLDYQGQILWHYNTGGMAKARSLGSYPYPRGGIVQSDYQHILIFKKPGDTQVQDKENAQLSHHEWHSFFSQAWYIPGELLSKPGAAMPLQVPMRLTRMFSGPGETVLDPFAKNGMTGAAARLLSRHSNLYEQNIDQLAVIAQNLEADAVSTTGDTFEFVKD